MMKGQKGITLVALVITIIVMLILAGVTISIAINSGLFNQAKEAKTETQKAMVKEATRIAISAAVAQVNHPSNTKDADTIANDIVAEINKAVAGSASTVANSGVVTVSKDGYTATVTITPTSGTATNVALTAEAE